MTREFIVERYATGSWPIVRGQQPFLARGPRFTLWIDPPIDSFSDPRLRPAVLSSLRGAFPIGTFTAEDAIEFSDFLLREGIVSALWVSNQRTSLVPSARWQVSCDQVSRQVLGFYLSTRLSDFDLASEVASWLPCLGQESYFREYVAEDGLLVEADVPPPQLSV